MSRKKRHWKLTDEEYEFIKGEVIHLFKIYNVRCIPVSGFELAVKMGLILRPYSSLNEEQLEEAMRDSEDGCFAEKYGEEVIFYNDLDKNYERQNWTILHEIGHVVLDHTGRGEKEEDEANFFAKYAIAPPVLVHMIKANSPEDIYDRFCISYEAACYAYDYYLAWKENYRKEGRLKDYEKSIVELFRERA